MVYGITLFWSIGSDRRGTDVIRREKVSGFTTLGILDETQKMMTELKCEPEHFQGRIIYNVH